MYVRIYNPSSTDYLAHESHPSSFNQPNEMFLHTTAWLVHNSIWIYVVHSPTNALFINLVKTFKFTLKYTKISLLHVSVFNDHHQGALSVPN